ncbi:MAG: hypothetical protein FWH02_05515 [Oscillospiraceae bacterium]|nr:hypothetical protein [Oscillospiraceae bacterium]
METTAIAGMYGSMEETGLYRLNQNSLIDHELAAYNAAFSVIEKLLEDIRGRAFVQTSLGAGLAEHERMVGLGGRDALPPVPRRDMVLYRLAVAPRDFTRGGMVRSMKAAGIDADIIESPQTESISVRSNVFLDTFDGMDALRARLSEMLPAHLDWEFDTGSLTWDMLDGADITWDNWDGLDFIWDEFDIEGHTIFA